MSQGTILKKNQLSVCQDHGELDLHGQVHQHGHIFAVFSLHEVTSVLEMVRKGSGAFGPTNNTILALLLATMMKMRAYMDLNKVIWAWQLSSWSYYIINTCFINNFLPI